MAIPFLVPAVGALARVIGKIAIRTGSKHIPRILNFSRDQISKVWKGAKKSALKSNIRFQKLFRRSKARARKIKEENKNKKVRFSRLRKFFQRGKNKKNKNKKNNKNQNHKRNRFKKNGGLLGLLDSLFGDDPENKSFVEGIIKDTEEQKRKNKNELLLYVKPADKWNYSKKRYHQDSDIDDKMNVLKKFTEERTHSINDIERRINTAFNIILDEKQKDILYSALAKQSKEVGKNSKFNDDNNESNINVNNNDNEKNLLNFFSDFLLDILEILGILDFLDFNKKRRKIRKRRKNRLDRIKRRIKDKIRRNRFKKWLNGKLQKFKNKTKNKLFSKTRLDHLKEKHKQKEKQKEKQKQREKQKEKQKQNNKQNNQKKNDSEKIKTKKIPKVTRDDYGGYGEEVDRQQKAADSDTKYVEEKKKEIDRKVKEGKESAKKIKEWGDKRAWYNPAKYYAKAAEKGTEGYTAARALKDKAALEADKAALWVKRKATALKNFATGVVDVKKHLPDKVKEAFSGLLKGSKFVKPVLKKIPFIGGALGFMFAMLDLMQAKSNYDVRKQLGGGFGSLIGSFVGSIIGAGAGVVTVNPIIAALISSAVTLGGEWLGEKISTVGIRPIDILPWEYYDTPLEVKQEIFKQLIESDKDLKKLFDSKTISEVLNEGKHLQGEAGLEKQLANFLREIGEKAGIIENNEGSEYETNTTLNPNAPEVKAESNLPVPNVTIKDISKPIEPFGPAVEAANYAFRNASPKSIRKCATYVNQALRAMGFKIPRVNSAYQLHTSGVLTKAGFDLIANNALTFVKQGKAIPGDVVVNLPINAKSSDGGWEYKEHGHVQIFYGKGERPWVSDFRQYGIQPWIGVSPKDWDRISFLYRWQRHLGGKGVDNQVINNKNITNNIIQPIINIQN